MKLLCAYRLILLLPWLVAVVFAIPVFAQPGAASLVDPLIGKWSAMEGGYAWSVKIIPSDKASREGYTLRGIMVKPWPFFSRDEEVLRLKPTGLSGVYEGEQKWKNVFHISRWSPARAVLEGGLIFTQFNSVRGPTLIPTTWKYVREDPLPVEPAPRLSERDPGPSERLPGDVGQSGSGFLVLGSRHVLTAAHVVKDAQRIRVLWGDEEYDAVLVLQDTRNDLAVLSVPGLSVDPDAGLPIDVSASVRPGETVWAIGFPLGDLLGRAPSILSGLVSASSGLGDDPTQFRIAASINAGTSGGPILNRYGQVVGIAVGYVQRKLAEGIGLGIKIGAAAPLAPPLPITSAASPREPLPPDRLYELAARAVVRVVTEGR